MFLFLKKNISFHPGVGKTTLCRKVYEVLKEKGIQILGFYTEEVRTSPEKSRVGFDIVTLDGQRGPLARVKRYCIFVYIVHFEHKFFYFLIHQFLH